MKNYISTFDFTDLFETSMIYPTIEEVMKNRANWALKGIAEIEMDSHGRLIVNKYYSVKEILSARFKED